METPYEELVQRMRELAPTSTKRGAAAILGVSEGWVRHHARKHGIEFQGRNDVYSDRELRRFVKLCKGHGMREASRMVGIPYSTFKNVLRRARQRAAAPKKKVDTEYLHKLRSAAINHALKNGRRLEDAEDFASYCIIESLSRDTPIQFKWNFINWDKDQYGNTQCESGKVKRRAYLYGTPIDHTDEGLDDDGRPIGHIPVAEDASPAAEVLQAVEGSHPHLKAVGRLVVLYGFTSADISRALGLDLEAAEEMCRELQAAVAAL